MNTLSDYLFKLRDDALEAAMLARGDLSDVLLENEDHRFAAAMEQVALTQPYARWWMRVTDEIEHGGSEAMAALTKTRTAARQCLLETCQAPDRSWFDIAQNRAATEATRKFYQDTAIFNLDTITGTGPARPLIATSRPGTTPG